MRKLIDRTLPKPVPYGLSMRYLLVDTMRSPGLNRALHNVADSVFRLLREWLAGEEWAGWQRVLTRWIMKALVPAGRQPEEALPENAGLAELSAMLEGEMRTWEDNFREAAEAKGRAQGRTELLVKMARHKFGEVPAAEMATLLKTVQSGEALDAVGELLLTCHGGEELLSRVREI